MSLNNNIKKIDLEAFSDLSMYNQDVHDYEGFCKINSLFLNKRLNAWKRRKLDNNEFYTGYKYAIDFQDYKYVKKETDGTVTYEKEYFTNTDDFAIYKSTDTENPIMQFSRNAYKMEAIDSVPTTGVKKVSAITTSGAIENSNGNLIINRISVDQTYARCWVIDISDEKKLYIAFTKNDNEALAANRKKSLDIYSYNTTTKESNKIFSEIVESDSHSIILDRFFVGYDNIVYLDESGNIKVSDSKYISVAGLPGEVSTESLSAGDVKSNAGFYIQCLSYDSDKDEISKEIEKTYSKTVDVTSEEIGTKSYIFPYSINELVSFVNGKSYNDKGSIDAGKIFLLSQKDISSKATFNESDSTISTIYNHYYRMIFVDYTATTTSTYSVDVFKISNYSLKCGKFAVNFVSNTVESISHDFKKLVYVSDTNIYYDDDNIYFTSDGTIYRIYIEKIDYPDLLNVINANYLIFNTTEYANAYCINSSGDMSFCSCDDWNMRFTFMTKKDYSMAQIPVESCMNYNWISSKTFVQMSAQYSAQTMYVSTTSDGKSTDPNGVELVFADYDYMMHGKYRYFKAGVRYDGGLSSEGKTLEMGVPKFDVYFYTTIPTGSETQSMYKQGYFTLEQDSSGNDYVKFTIQQDTSVQYVSGTQYDVPPLLLCNYIYNNDNDIYVITNKNVYTLSKFNSSTITILALCYVYDPSTIVSKGSTIFYINGSAYIYDSSSNRISYVNAVTDEKTATATSFCADTSMFSYIGYNPLMALFFCSFDHGIYAFQGDNTFTRLATIERYNIKYSGTVKSRSNTEITNSCSATSIPSIGLTLINLTTALGVIYNNQFCIIDIGETINELNSSNVDVSKGTFTVNNREYSIIADNINGDIETVPVEIETEFYGDPNTMNNTVNDTVYITVYNKLVLDKGTVELQTYALQDGEIVKGKVRTITLYRTDFNSYNAMLIKYQPDIQEARGIKYYIKSDFDITDIKIDTQPTSVTQSKIRR